MVVWPSLFHLVGTHRREETRKKVGKALLLLSSIVGDFWGLLAEVMVAAAAAAVPQRRGGEGSTGVGSSDSGSGAKKDAKNEPTRKKPLMSTEGQRSGCIEASISISWTFGLPGR